MTTSQTTDAVQADLAHNPLLDESFLIPFDRIKPEHAAPAVDAVLAQARQRLDWLVSAQDRGFVGFLDDFDHLTERLSQVSVTARHLNSVVSDDGWRAAEQEILPKLTAFQTDLGMHEGLYRALRTYAATPEAAGLDPVRARFLTTSLDDFRRGGAELEGDDRERLKAINVELSELTSQYRNNTMDGIKAYELYVAPGRLAGLPERLLEATAADAAKQGRAGQHRLTLHAPIYVPVLEYAEDRTLREELYRAFNRVGTGEGRDNRPLLPRILELRREKARLLGFRDFADFILEDRMAGGGERALRFERELEGKTRPAFERERAELEAYYRQQAGAQAPALAAWDLAYWAEKQRAATYEFDNEEVRPYLEVGAVMRGMFEIVRRVFGVRVEETQAPVWHPEVRVYSIYGDLSGEHLASFYTDWFPRDSKRGGAWMNGLKTGGPRPGSFEPHLGLMCGNMTAPDEQGLALLSHDEVQTVFHEFGHLLHHALSRVPVRSLAGTSVAWDFVELPSQIMENWTWNREALDLFARHHETGEPLPDELYQRMIAARNFRAASFAMRQYSFGTMDLELHTQYTPEDGDITRYASAVLARFMPAPPIDDYAAVTNFGHLFASSVGYAAGYYSYKWAEVLEADAFSRFEQDGVFNRQTGQAFVDTVLSRGNSAAPATLYREFMGRDPDADALLRRSGLIE